MIETGVRQVGEGDYVAALYSLDAALRRSGPTLPQRDVAKAYLYLGAAYVQLDQPKLGEAKFRRALIADPSIRAGGDQFSRKVTAVFERALLQRKAVGAKRRRRIAAFGAAVLAGGGIGWAASNRPTERPANRPPQPSLAVQPQGIALANATRVSFVALASDPDGDAVTYQWDFGDGGAAATGSPVTRVFTKAGTYTVRLTASDPKGASASTMTTVQVGTLDGAWVADWCTGINCNTRGGNSFDCVQREAVVQCVARSTDEAYRWFEIRLAHPRAVSGRVTVDPASPGRPLPVDTTCAGDVLADLKSLECLGNEAVMNFGLRRP